MKPDLELVFKGVAQLGPPTSVGDTPQGSRRVVPITGGSFEGEKMRGEILSGGADWQFTRPDGVSELEALYLLRTHDGVHIQVRNYGTRHGPPDVFLKIMAGEHVSPDAYYFRAVPKFSAPAGPYEWLNRYVFLCTGERFASSVTLWFYRVT
jgi:hypothetical protein